MENDGKEAYVELLMWSEKCVKLAEKFLPTEIPTFKTSLQAMGRELFKMELGMCEFKEKVRND